MAPNNEQGQHYGTHQYAGDQAANTRRVMNHMPDEDRSTTQEIQQHINTSQAAELAPAVRMGDDRVIGDTPNWDGFDSEQLYNFATENNSPTTADDLGRAFNTGGNSLADAANGLLDAVTQLDSAWSGSAADSARKALAPLAQAAGLAGQTAQMMGVQMSQQSVAATEVRKLPPPEKFDQKQSLNAMVTGGPLAMQQDMKAQKDAADAVKREQITYLNTYTQSLTNVDAQTPSFVPPEEIIGGGGNGRTPISGGEVYVPTSTPIDYSTTTGAPPSKYTGVAGPDGGMGWADNNGQTDESNFTPLPGTGTGTSNFTPTTSPATPTTFGPGGGGGVNAVPGAGAGGFGGGFGNFGGSGGSGSGANPGGAGPRGGGFPGGGPGGGAPGGMAPGGRGGSGMGGAPRGKGDREEDQEHDRPSYLVEGDPESTFGNDALTAPPVIGGDDD